MMLIRPSNGLQSRPVSHSLVDSHLMFGLPIASGAMPGSVPYGELKYVERFLKLGMLLLPVSPKLPRSFSEPNLFLKFPMKGSSEITHPAATAGKYPHRLLTPNRESPSARMLPCRR